MFFFNDTATTEIYTLSLHDALPSLARSCAQTPTGMSAVLGGEPDEVLAAIERHGLVPANRNGGGQVVAAGSLEGLEALDRKSTRLNSSHANISYAVFCLKKKDVTQS